MNSFVDWADDELIKAADDYERRAKILRVALINRQTIAHATLNVEQARTTLASLDREWCELGT